MTGRASRRALAGAMKNVASQLAQIATGFEASFDGDTLLAQPDRVGSYVVDVVNKASLLNGQPADLRITQVLADWTRAELSRLHRVGGWLRQALVSIDYVLIPSSEFIDAHPGYWTSQAYVVQLTALVSVVTQDGEAEAEYQNVQAVIGQLADPVRPIPTTFGGVGSESRVFQIKQSDLSGQGEKR